MIAATAPLASRKNLRRVSRVAEITVVLSASSYIPGNAAGSLQVRYMRAVAGFLPAF